MKISDALEDLIKAEGEGSRGGNIVGHTSSGKPIYHSAGNAAHKKFSKKEHNEAYHAHSRKRNALAEERHQTGNPDGTVSKQHIKRRAQLQKQIEHHHNQAQRHQAISEGNKGSPDQKDFDRMDRQNDPQRRSRSWGRSLGEEKMDFFKSIGINVGEPSLINEKKEDEQLKTDIQKGGFDMGRQGSDPSFRERLQKSMGLGTEIHIGGRKIKKAYGSEEIKNTHGEQYQGEASDYLIDGFIVPVNTRHTMDEQECANHLKATPESLISQEPTGGDEKYEDQEAAHSMSVGVVIVKSELTHEELLLKALDEIGKGGNTPPPLMPKIRLRPEKGQEEKDQDKKDKEYMLKKAKKKEDKLFEVVKDKTPKKIIRDVHENSDFGSLKRGCSKKSELDEVFDLLKAAPKGVDPAKHERCVKEVKSKGHDVGSAHAICTSSMKGTANKSFIKAAGQGGIVFDFGPLTGNPLADNATALLNRHADHIQSENARYQQNAYDAALDSYVKKGNAEYTKHTTPFGNVDKEWSNQLNKPMDQQVAEAFAKGELAEDGGPAVKNQFNKTEISLGGQVIKATSPTDAALIEMMNAEAKLEKSDGGFIADATGVTASSVGIVANTMGVTADAVSKN